VTVITLRPIVDQKRVWRRGCHRPSVQIRTPLNKMASRVTLKPWRPGFIHALGVIIANRHLDFGRLCL